MARQGAMLGLCVGSEVLIWLSRRVASLYRSSLVFCWASSHGVEGGRDWEGRTDTPGARPAFGFARYKRAGWAWVCVRYMYS